MTSEERDADWARSRAMARSARAILCVGAGPTGIESASYLKESFPNKRVALCQRGKVLLRDFPDGHDKVMDELKKIGVEVMLETPYTPGSNLDKEFEFVLDCRGSKFAGPAKFLTGKYSECIDKKSGQILVNSYGQVTNHHPIVTDYKPEKSIILSNVFSFGDVCLTPANEVKCVVSMY